MYTLLHLLYAYNIQLNTLTSTWAIQKLTRFDKKFRSSDNQYLIKFWLLTFSTMEILNPKVGTVPKNFVAYKSPRALCSVFKKYRVCFGRRFKTIIKII